MNDEQFGWWLTGLADGEGHFGVTKATLRPRPFYRCVFRVAMSAADRDMLAMAYERTGWGRLYEYERNGRQQRPVVIWTTSAKDVGLVVDHFERFPLQSKKAEEFALWLPAARAQVARRPLGGGRRDEGLAETMAAAYEALRAMDRGGRLARAA